jgi:DNA-directed RNA polymerase subunit M/transcription elongation factor TFIIS
MNCLNCNSEMIHKEFKDSDRYDCTKCTYMINIPKDYIKRIQELKNAHKSSRARNK